MHKSSLPINRIKEVAMVRTTLTARISASFYALWGIFHVVAASAVYNLAQTVSPGMVQGRLLQNAFYLLFFACLGIIIALTLNWHNNRQGYWMNGVLIATADVPFVLFVLVPGYIPWWPGLIGPILWALAFICASYARFIHAA
jgi:hypothetical protein